MKPLTTFILVFYILLLNGCTYTTTNLEVIEDYSPVMSYSNDIYREPFNLFTINHSYITSPYEPLEGIYLGAYILKSLNSYIQSFETIVQKPHAIYANTMRLGDPLPETWLLECMAHMRTPYLTLTHSNLGNKFNIEQIIELAKELGKFRVPIFLDFLPNQRQHNYNPEEYVNFFKESRHIFREYAPNVIFVWSIFEDDVLDSAVFYPGDEYVDWVGISIFKDVSRNGDPFEQGMFNRLDAFYYTHQNNKPIIISSLGISHFSTINHIYHPITAGEKIKYFYERILRDYPRIRGIIYMDINTIENPILNYYKDNFSITTNPTILEFYRQAILDDRFLSSVDFNLTSTVQSQLIKSPFNVYKINHNIYVCQNVLIYDLGKTNLSDFYKYRIEIDSSPYYNLSMLSYSKVYNMLVDVNLRRVIIS